MKIAPRRRGEQQMAEFKKLIAKLKKHYGCAHDADGNQSGRRKAAIKLIK
jgi:hypothetical protein